LAFWTVRPRCSCHVLLPFSALGIASFEDTIANFMNTYRNYKPQLAAIGNSDDVVVLFSFRIRYGLANVMVALGPMNLESADSLKRFFAIRDKYALVAFLWPSFGIIFDPVCCKLGTMSPLTTCDK
jgi:hypothetical protein